VNRFLQSVFESATVVLQRRLRPFCCFHWAALTVTESPFVVGGLPSPDDVVFAVWVCQRGWSDRADILDPDYEAAREWGHEFDHVAACTALREYIEAAFDGPETWVPEKAKASGIPAPFHLPAILLQHLHGLTEAEAWDMPLQRALAYRCAIAEANGADVVNDRQLALIKEAQGRG
jgi:hypothetical protein